jgi:hypothetical protein
VRAMGPVAIAIALLATTPFAFADDKAECLSSYVGAQELRRLGKLGAARDEAARCGRDACPVRLRDDCVTWVRELDTSLPSVVLSARGSGQVDVIGARAFIDGAAVPGALDGRAHPLDPGAHSIRVEAEGWSTVETSIVLGEGEHARPVPLVLQPVAPPPRQGRSLLPMMIPAGVAAVGVGVFATFGLWGYYGSPGYQSLHQCEPMCSASDVETVRTRFFVSDIGLGVAIAGAAALTVIWLTHRHSDSPPTPQASFVERGLRVSF